MITPDFLSRILTILEVHKELQESILRDIVRRIMKTDFSVTETDVYQAEILQSSGMCFDEITARIAEASDLQKLEVQQVFEDAKVEVFNYDDAVLNAVGIEPVKFKALSPQMMKVYAAALKDVTGEVLNLTRTTAATSQTAFINCCNVAHMQIVSGGFSYPQAIKEAIISASQQDTKVVYPSGHIQSLDAAVRRAVLTGVNETCVQVSEMRADEFDVDIMEITAHAGARPDHAQWQGKLVSRSGQKGYLTLDDIGYGTVTGFMGANCRHDWNMFFEGYSKRAYTDEELSELENATVTYNGEEIPEWKALSKQRGMERNIKELKRELVGLDEARKNTEDAELLWELESGFEKKAVRLKSKEAELADFCSQTGLKRDRYREQVFATETENGIKAWTKSVSGKAVHSAQEHYDVWRKSVGASNTPETLAKYYDMKYNDKEEYSRLNKYITALNNDTRPLLGYEYYRKCCLDIEKELIGITSSAGIKVEDYSSHFVCRYIGKTDWEPEKRNSQGKEPVPIESIKEALKNGKIGKTKIDELGRPSILHIGADCMVSVNPNDGNLVQVNMISR